MRETFVRACSRALLMLTLSLAGVGAVLADEPTDVQAGDSIQLPDLPEDAGVDQLSARLELIRQRVSADSDDGLLSNLRQSALAVQARAEQNATDIGTALSRTEDQLKVLGPVTPNEAESLTRQRNDLTDAQKDLQKQLERANQLDKNAQDLAAQIVNLRRSQFNSQIATRYPPPLSPSFWSTLIRPTDDDLTRLQSMRAQIGDALSTVWQPEHRSPFIASLLVALLLWIPGRRLLEQLLTKAMIRWIPVGRLRRSALAVAVGLATILTLGGGATVIHEGMNWHGQLSGNMDNLGNQMLSLVIFCTFTAGLGRALLAVQRPSWRLPDLPDPVATALSPFPWLMAWMLLVLGTLDRINSSSGASLALTVAVNGLTALATALLYGIALYRYRVARREAEGHETSPLAGILVFAMLVTVLLIVLALATGYLSLAYFFAGKLLWASVVCATGYLLTSLFVDLCEVLLSPRQPIGERLAENLGVDPRHQAQFATLLTGAGRTLLVLSTLLIAFSTSGTSPGELLQGLVQLVESGQSLGRLNIVPQDILLALGTLAAGLFGLRLLKRWLADELLPETRMDAGMRASLVTLVGYIGMVILVLLVLSALRINLTSLTWVVSALSVGIGFGLQAIVQNFISGLILLTERPVKVGDWVSLTGGVEGDIRRINVRATEIQMSDQSTVIVPNSQFISQNVRNVTMGSALGVVGINLTLPLDTDVQKVRELMLKAYSEHENIVETPAPSVTFKDLSATGLTLAASGNVSSPRAVYSTKSDLLFTIFSGLREAGISLSTPQNLILQRPQLARAEPADEAATPQVGDDTGPNPPP
ncbi:mechanosensitive ion channel family protein [Pseudomonas sp. PDM23]|uniref:DUF3772 domain-containing protein n=1 Tax=unclassified Pseudomonas TaxID=196821 RepID=UPI001786C496|nr:MULTISPECIES: DUF3772 domain-containing protein [unclassified Pseudomonas]MBD9575381.1 mechanosensitive ion channel family protein [Pseudomonas sp. PDM23]MBD9669677.1 mechanosensitive ion channel family protein [Pseudomonas sp. PDM21]MDL2428024.1 DUF3772 domain-containing protein [Pseudomonas sp. BJa5]